MRFDALLDRTVELGCDVLVTGHHARVEESDGVFKLRTAVDGTKDQSYVLHMLDQDALSRVKLPVGEMTKVAVREYADERGLRTAHKPDSQDICFVTSGDYRDFLRAMLPEVAAPGAVVDTDGNVVGEHGGTAGFTIGQRKGLGVAVGEPRFVLDISPTERTVTIGTYDDLLVDGCVVTDMRLTGDSPTNGDSVSVKVRYRSSPAPATITESGETWRFEFEERQPRPAPGQALVMYDGEYVLGGGTIIDEARAVTRSG